MSPSFSIASLSRMSPSFSTSSLNRMSPSFSTSSKGFDNVNTIHTYIFNKHYTLGTMYEEIKEDATLPFCLTIGHHCASSGLL
jgi:hypothetical protein